MILTMVLCICAGVAIGATLMSVRVSREERQHLRKALSKPRNRNEALREAFEEYDRRNQGR